MSNRRLQALSDILSEIDLTSKPLSSPTHHHENSISSSDGAFADVTSFLNIETKPTTLFELKKVFTSHTLLDDEKVDINDARSVEEIEDDEHGIYEKEQFLTYIHYGDSVNDLSSNHPLQNNALTPQQYSLSVLSRNIINPMENASNHVKISSSPDPLEYATSVPAHANIYANPRHVCSQNGSIRWKFDFVTTSVQWRPEFIDGMLDDV